MSDKKDLQRHMELTQISLQRGHTEAEKKEYLQLVQKLEEDVNRILSVIINPEVLEPLRNHLAMYWKESVRYFNESNYPLATFFAITLIEETSKIYPVHIKNGLSKEGSKFFYNHVQKYNFVIPNALSINNRVRNKYKEYESIFINIFQNGLLFKIRNDALYIDIKKNGASFPKESIDFQTAFIIVCFAGEIYAELQGGFTHSPAESHLNDHERILNEIDTFFDTYFSLLD